MHLARTWLKEKESISASFKPHKAFLVTTPEPNEENSRTTIDSPTKLSSWNKKHRQHMLRKFFALNLLQLGILFKTSLQIHTS